MGGDGTKDGEEGDNLPNKQVSGQSGKPVEEKKSLKQTSQHSTCKERKVG